VIPDNVSLIQDDPPPVDLEEGGCGTGALLLLGLHSSSTRKLKLILKFDLGIEQSIL
jgi:hypothetical protein